MVRDLKMGTILGIAMLLGVLAVEPLANLLVQDQKYDLDVHWHASKFVFDHGLTLSDCYDEIATYAQSVDASCELEG